MSAYPHIDYVPDLQSIKQARESLGNLVRETPTWKWESSLKDDLFGKETEIFLKLELFQFGGSFKPRGALINMKSMGRKELQKGVTAVSAGNHAIAVGYSARVMNSSAKVVMPRTANPARINRCRSYGAEVILKDDVHQAFEEVHRIEREEGRTFVHPFEGLNTILGTSTVGFELMNQVKGLDAVVVPIGGGGLMAGVATAVKQMNPDIKVFGVEPEGANTMTLSFASGKPEAIDKVRTIADSLGAPYAAPYSFTLCKKFVDDIVLITDQDMCNAMSLLFHELKLAVEPAGAASTAALMGPLNDKLRGMKVGLIVCGTNMDRENFISHLQKAEYNPF